MGSSRLFWKLFLAYAGLIGTAAAVFAGFISARQEQQVLRFFRERLHDDAAMLRAQVAGALAAGRHDGLQDLTRRLAGETATRMTLIARDGTAGGMASALGGHAVGPLNDEAMLSLACRMQRHGLHLLKRHG